jgi:tetratricopeptide (TPR) repeat protein
MLLFWQGIYHPLVLIGFGLVLLFGIYRGLLKAGLLKPLSSSNSYQILRLIFDHSFILIFLLIGLGFGLEFFKQSNQIPIDQNAIVHSYIKSLKSQLEIKDNQIKALGDVVKTLDEGRGKLASSTDIDLALQAFAKGEKTRAEVILKKLLEQKTAEGKQANQQAAAAARHLGALAFLDNTQVALNYYRQATELAPDNVDGWFQLGLLFQRIGELNQAITAYQRIFILGEQQQSQMLYAVAYGNLGVVYQIKGNLAKSEEYFLQALEINKQLGRKRGMATNYGNLGNIYGTKGDLDKAEEYYLQAFEIDKSLGSKEGMALEYSNLGIIYQTKGELEKAEEYQLLALELDKVLQNKQGMATDYGNLGVIYDIKGDFVKAENYYLNSLEIAKELGHKEGVANQYGNLGNIYQIKGELEKAEKFYLQTLEIHKKIGYKEGIAISCSNLGSLYVKQGNIKKARNFYQESIVLFDELGNEQKIQQVQRWLDDLLNAHPNQNPE